MKVESLIPEILNPLVGDRVWFDATPDDGPPRGANGAFLDFIIVTVVGGIQEEYVDQTMGKVANSRVQIHAVSATSQGASDLILAARDMLLASGYTVSVYGSPVGTYDAARKLRGRFQQFSIWFPE